MRTSRHLLLAGAVALGGLLLAGCSENAVSQSDVETEAETQLAAQVEGATPDVSCPGDLTAEVDETMECELTVEGDDAVYPVTIRPTSTSRSATRPAARPPPPPADVERPGPAHAGTRRGALSATGGSCVLGGA